MAYEFKKLGDVEVVETPMDTANVLIEEDGVIKKTAMNNIGTVKSINGLEPDENGNIEVDMGGVKTINGESPDENGDITIESVVSWNDLEDKPFWSRESRAPFINETTFTIDDEGLAWNVLRYAGEGGITPEENLIVTFDGTEYSAKHTTDSDVVSHITITVNGTTVDIRDEQHVYAPGLEGRHTVKVERPSIEVKYMDSRCIKDMYREDIEYVTYVPEQTITLVVNGNNTSASARIPNIYLPWDWVPYRVTLDGVEYEGIFYDNGDNGWIPITLGDGTNMTIEVAGYVYIDSAAYAGNHTIKVEQKQVVITTIDNKYLDIPVRQGTGERSVCLNPNSYALGNDSCAENNSRAEGRYSHAENQSTATGDYSHAEGRSFASGVRSHAEGESTTALGTDSHVEGYYTTASHKSQHVIGEYNALDTSTNSADQRGNYVLIVGNGTGTSTSRRSNAHTLDWNGNAWYAGTVEGTTMIVKSSTPGSTKRFKITVDDSGTITATAI